MSAFDARSCSSRAALLALGAFVISSPACKKATSRSDDDGQSVVTEKLPKKKAKAKKPAPAADEADPDEAEGPSEGDQDDDESPPSKANEDEPKAHELDLVGRYAIKGAGPDGVAYKGAATLARIGGEMYRGTWTVGARTYEGTAFRDGDVLSCAWAKKGSSFGVVAYLVKDDNSLDGVWFMHSDDKLGKEVLVGGSSNLTGTYNIKKGETPKGDKYQGSATFSLKSGVYQITWKLGSSVIKGLGLRNGDVLSAGFTEDFTIGAEGTSYGVLQYRITKAGSVLTGSWAQSSSKSPGVGTETMTKL